MGKIYGIKYRIATLDKQSNGKKSIKRIEKRIALATSMYIVIFFVLKLMVKDNTYTFTLLTAFVYTMLILPFFIYDDILNRISIMTLTQFLSITDILHRYIYRSYYSLANSSQVFQDDMYIKCMTLVCIWLFMFYVGYLSGGKALRNKQSSSSHLPLKNSWLIIILTICLSIGGFMLATRATGGIVGMFNNMENRVDVYSGIGYLKDIVSLGTIASILLLYKGYTKLSIVILILTFWGLALFGGRGPAIFYTIFPYMLFYHYLVKGINRKKLMTIGTLLLIFVVFWGQIRSYGSINNVEMDFLNLLWNASSQTAMGITLPVVLNYLQNEIIHFQNFNFLFNIFFAVIPRALWSDKPAIDTTGIIGKLLFGEDHWGRWAGPYGIAFLSFGWIGVLVMGFIAGYVVKKLYRRLLNTNSVFYTVFYCLTIRLFIDLFSTGGQLRIVWFGAWIIILGIVTYINFRKEKIPRSNKK